MKKRSRFLTLFYMVLSCVLCSIAVNWVALPNGFVVTGLTGLSMTAASCWGINYALIFYGLTLLMLLCTFLTLGYSYGGTDTLAKILKKKVFRAVELKNIMLALEGTIMVVMLSAFSLDVVAYAFVGQIIYINCMNYMVFNLGPKLYEVEIICDHPAEIERFIIDEIHKSATIDQVIGGYSKEPKTQLDCVCNSREYVQLREFMRDQGFDCFIKVYPLTHVFGHNKDFHRLDDENLE